MLGTQEKTFDQFGRMFLLNKKGMYWLEVSSAGQSYKGSVGNVVNVRVFFLGKLKKKLVYIKEKGYT